MGKGVKLCVVSKRNQPIHGKDEQEEPSEEKIIPALRQATKRLWGICRNNADYSQSYLRPLLIPFPHFSYGVKISAFSSETTLPNFRSHLGMPHALSKWYPCLVSLIPGGSPQCFPISFGDVVVQPLSVHRAEEERKFSSSTGLGFGFSPFSRR